MALDLSNITPTLSVGQVFKNYKELCSALQLEVRNGKSKRLQMEEVKRFMNLDKQGHKFIITEIYPTPIPKEIKENKRNSKYKDLIDYLFIEGLCELTRNNGNKQIEITCDLRQLAHSLSMIKWSFYWRPDEQWLEAACISKEQCREICYSIKQREKGCIETVLKSSQRNHLINYSKEKFFVPESQSSEFIIKEEMKHRHSRLLTEEEKRWYDKAYKETIDSFNKPPLVGFGEPFIYPKEYFHFGDIIAHKKVSEFYSRLNEKIEERFSVDARIYEAYKISTTSELVEYAKGRVCDRDKLLETAMALNGKLRDENIIGTSPISEITNQIVSIAKRSYNRHIESLLTGKYYEQIIVEGSSTVIEQEPEEQELQTAS